MRKRIRKFFKGLYDPPVWFIWTVYLTFAVSLVLSIFVATSAYNRSVYAYIDYIETGVVMAYALYLTSMLIVRAKRKYGSLKACLSFIKRFLLNFEFRTTVFGLFSFIGNAAYALFLFYLAAISRAGWYVVLAVYYILLTFARGGVLLDSRKNERRFKNDPLQKRKNNLSSYFYCGAMMFALTLSLSIAVVQMVEQGARFQIPAVSIYVVAGFALYRIITAIVNYVRIRRYDDLAARAIQSVNMATALVTLLILQTALFDKFQFSFHQALINAMSGAAVCYAIFVIGIQMIIYAVSERKHLKELEQGKEVGYNRADYQEEYGVNQTENEK